MTPSETIFTAIVTDGMRRAHRAAELVWEETNESVRPVLIADDGQLDAADIDNLPSIGFWFGDDIAGECWPFVDVTLGELVLMMTEVVRVGVAAARQEKQQGQEEVDDSIPVELLIAGQLGDVSRPPRRGLNKASYARQAVLERIKADEGRD